VEDHDDSRWYLGLFLDRLGATVVVASNGFEGLEAVKINHPDLVVSDIQMPGMDGFELLREIRALGSDAGGSVPVVAMTAFGTHADRERLLQSGFKRCLLKPFTPEKLLETISERAQRLSDRFADRNEAWDLLWISVCFSDHVLHFLGGFCENI
jgi:CheY-like chemotaxis protein